MTASHSPVRQYYLQGLTLHHLPDGTATTEEARVRAIELPHGRLYLAFPPARVGDNGRFFAAVDHLDRPVGLMQYCNGRAGPARVPAGRCCKYGHVLGARDERLPWNAVPPAVSARLAARHAHTHWACTDLDNNAAEEVARGVAAELQCTTKAAKVTKHYLAMPLHTGTLFGESAALLDSLASACGGRQQARKIAGRTLLRQVLLALQPLHAAGLMHLHVCPDNLALKSPPDRDVTAGALCLLGIGGLRRPRASQLSGADVFERGGSGTRAPEQLAIGRRGLAADIWAAAATVTQCLGAWTEGDNYADPFQDAEAEDGLHAPSWLAPYVRWYECHPTDAQWADGFAAYERHVTAADPALGALLRRMRHYDPDRRPCLQTCLAELAPDGALTLSPDERTAADAALLLRSGWARSVERNLAQVRRWRPLLEAQFPQLLALRP